MKGTSGVSRRCASGLLLVGTVLVGCGYGPLPAAGPGDDFGDANTGGPCRTSTDCSGTNSSVCDISKDGGTCVQCTAGDNSACTANTPVCNAATDSCQACATDADCPIAVEVAGVCMPSGACADKASIVYVSAGGSTASADCGANDNSCDLNTALLIVSIHPERNVLKLASDTYKSTGVNYNIDANSSTKLVVDARGATFHPNGNGAIITVGNGKELTLLGGTIETAVSDGGANTGDGDGVACGSDGTFAAYGTVFQDNDSSAVDANSCDLTLSGVSIHDNSRVGSFPGINTYGGKIELSRSQIANQRGGGLNLGNNAAFNIVGNVFFNNGDVNSLVGGVSLSSTAITNHFIFNTVANNKSKSSVIAGGVFAAASDLIASNNIIYGNNGTSDPQVSGGPFAYCDIGPTPVAGAADGGHNFSDDPMFENPTSDFQLRPTSPARGKADPTADLTGLAARDINGMPRLAPADPGAYVVPAQ